MKKLVFYLIIVFFTTNSGAQPIPVKLNHSVIIDTDCAIDDMRAISLLLARPEIAIKAILLSDGSLTPDEGAEKIGSLLHEFKCDSIPVAYGEALKGVNPPWRQFNRKISWGGESNYRVTALNALDCLSEQLAKANEKITLICLGPLTNIAQLVKE